MFRVVSKDHPKRKQGLCAAYYCNNKKAPTRAICHKHRARRLKELNLLRYTYDLLRSNAKRRGHEISLTLEEFKRFCDENNYLELKGRAKGKMSIDRKRSSEGYHYHNIKIMEYGANSAKGAADDVDPLDELEEAEEWDDLPF